MRNRIARASRPDSGERSFNEMKNLEWIFIGIHALAVPLIVVMARLHDPAFVTRVDVLAGLLALWSLGAFWVNRRIQTSESQRRLGLITQGVVAVFAWAIIFQFVSGERTAAYGVFAIVIVEGAFRFGLVGSLVMGVVSMVGQAGAMAYRYWEYDLAFSLDGYLFWVVLFMLVALAVGLVTEETRRERRRSANLVRERTLLEERNRIARDLHDTVLKTLHGLSLEAHALKKHVDSPAALEKVGYLQDVCQRSSQEIRDMIYELRSEEEHEGVASQMSRMVQEWSKSTGIETEFTVSGEDRVLPLLASYNLRSVLSEALLNIRKHATASLVGVSIELLPGELRLEIVDNGRGMASSGDDVYKLVPKGKYGIRGMKERVEQLNGQFSVDSRGGTRLVISVPLALAK